MTAATRIYAVIQSVDTTASTRLVRAATPAQALRHVAKDTFTVSVAGQEDLVAALGSNVKVETAGAEESSDE